jgi:monoterpene epsilon-lactone hydrolase
MSVRMIASRAFLRAAVKPRLERASLERLRNDDHHDPPSAIVAGHACEEEVRGGSRVVWLDRDRAADGVLAYVHGGSYVSGPAPNQWDYLARLGDATGLAGLLVDYRLAPEHPYPAALDDVVASIRGLGADWFLAGDSSGAAIAIAAAYRLRDEEGRRPRGLVLTSPSVDLTLEGAAERSDPMLTSAYLHRWWATYAGDRDRRDPLLSPLFGDPAGLAPVQITVGSRELFVAGARRWRDRCEAAGIAVDYLEQRGGFHGFPMSAAFLPEGRAAIARQAEFVNRLR